MVQGPTDTLYFEGMSGLTFTGSYTKDKLVVDYDYYFESYNGQFISYTWTGPTNSGYSRQVTPTASGLQLDIGYKIFSFLKPYIGLRSHTMNYGSSIMTTGNGFSYVEFYDNKKYVTAGVEIYYKFTKSLGLVISPEYSRAITLPSPMESGSLVTVTGGLRWDLDKVK